MAPQGPEPHLVAPQGISAPETTAGRPGLKRQGTVAAQVPWRDTRSLAESHNVVESVAGVVYRNFSVARQASRNLAAKDKAATSSSTEVKRFEPAGDGDDGGEGLRSRHVDGSVGGRNDAMTLDDMERLCFFERLFFQIDVDQTGLISVDECNLLLSFAALDMELDERERVFRRADYVEDGGLSRMEFVDLCRIELWHVPLEAITIAVDNLHAARNAFKAKWNAHWKEIAESVDAWARGIIPATYVASLLVLFHLNFDDDYMTNAKRMMGQPGYLTVRLSARGTVWVIVISLAGLLILLSWNLMDRIRKRSRERERLAERQAVRELANDLSIRVSRPPGCGARGGVGE